MVGKDTPLQDVWAKLSPEQQEHVRQSIRFPPVTTSTTDKSGEQFDFLNLGTQNLLDRIERGEFIGPVSETQVKRPVGTKAF